jgi:hypothetical protein
MERLSPRNCCAPGCWLAPAAQLAAKPGSRRQSNASGLPLMAARAVECACCAMAGPFTQVGVSSPQTDLERNWLSARMAPCVDTTRYQSKYNVHYKYVLSCTPHTRHHLLPYRPASCHSLRCSTPHRRLDASLNDAADPSTAKPSQPHPRPQHCLHAGAAIQVAAANLHDWTGQALALGAGWSCQPGTGS